MTDRDHPYTISEHPLDNLDKSDIDSDDAAKIAEYAERGIEWAVDWVNEHTSVLPSADEKDDKSAK